MNQQFTVGSSWNGKGYSGGNQSMKTLFSKITSSSLVLGALLVAMTAPVRATNISASMTVDNGFTAYISTNDSVAGTQIGSGNDWTSTYSFGSTLTSGVTNYLHIYSYDVGGIAAFIGQFTLSDTGFSFANGTQSLLTGTSNWNGSVTGFGSNYQTPIDLGSNGAYPWNTRPLISNAAHFIWVQDANNVNTAYFSAAITSNTPVPDGGATVAMLGLAVAGLAALRRKFGSS